MNTMYQELSDLVERINNARAVMNSYITFVYSVVKVNGKGYAVEYVQDSRVHRVYGLAAIARLKNEVARIEKDRDYMIEEQSKRDAALRDIATLFDVGKDVAHLELSGLTDVEKAVLGILPNSGEIFNNAMAKLSENTQRFVHVSRSHPDYY